MSKYSLFVVALLAMQATILPKFDEQTLPWARALYHLFRNCKTKLFGLWDTNHWDLVLGKLDKLIKGCSFSSKLLEHWKEVLHHIKWRCKN